MRETRYTFYNLHQDTENKAGSVNGGLVGFVNTSCVLNFRYMGR